MDSHSRVELISKDLEEVLTHETLKSAVETGVPLKHYIGFEISGTPHVGAAIKSLYHMKNFIDAGVECSIFLADWHAWINDKLGGDKQAIQRVGKGYFKECFSAAAKVVGVDEEKIRFVLGSELYHAQDAYWETVVDVAKHTTLARMQRSITILGRQEGESLDFAKLLYPAMQVADIYFQQITIAHAGMDQRKAHVVAREVAEKLQYHGIKHNGKLITPIAVHHHLVAGLQKPPMWPIPPEKLGELRSAMKMSKSQQGSAVFLGDSEADVKKKINNAFCMEKEIGYNPVLDWAQHLVFPFVKEVAIVRPEKFGGNVTYSNYKDLEADFAHGKLHPMDLKAGVGQAFADLLAPARKHLEHPQMLKLKEEFERLKVTRYPLSSGWVDVQVPSIGTCPLQTLNKGDFSFSRMPSGRQRQTRLHQRQKRRVKNKGGKSTYELWERQIRGAQKRKGIPPGKEFDADVKRYYEIKNLSTIEQMFRQHVRKMRTRDNHFLGKSALAILSVIRLHSEPTYYHNLRVGLLAAHLLEGEGRDPTLAFYGGALHDTGKALTEHSLLTGRDINADEYARIKAHAKDGFDVLKGHFKFCSAMAGMHHNEHSSGYGIEPKELDLKISPVSERLLHDVSVVIALADFVDAAMSRKAMVIKDPKLQGKPLRTMLAMAYPSQKDRIQRILASPLLSQFYSRKPE